MENEAKCLGAVFAGHEGVEIGGGDVIGTALVAAPLDKEAVGQATEHAQEEQGLGLLNATAVIIEGNIQSLVEAAFDAPALAVELEPLAGVEAFGGQTGNERDFLVLAAAALPQEPGGLSGEGKANILGADCGGGDGPVLRLSLVGLPGARLGGGGFIEGGNPLGERLLCFAGWPTGWADFSYTSAGSLPRLRAPRRGPFHPECATHPG